MEEIQHGDKMIKVSIHFWTNNLPIENQKMAWGAGVIHIMTNRSRGIRGTVNPIPFNNIEELPDKLKQLMKKEGIVLVQEIKGRKPRKLEIIE